MGKEERWLAKYSIYLNFSWYGSVLMEDSPLLEKINAIDIIAISMKFLCYTKHNFCLGNFYCDCRGRLICLKLSQLSVPGDLSWCFCQGIFVLANTQQSPFAEFPFLPMSNDVKKQSNRI